MTNIVAVRELVNGPRHLVLQVDIEGGGITEIIDNALVDVTDYDCREVRLDGIKGQITAFTLALEWDGSTKAPLFTIDSDNYIDLDWSRTGGITNPKMPDYNGDVVMSSSGLADGETGSLQFHFVKKDIP